jgi:SAM-dependent MidA family methyltransferase
VCDGGPRNARGATRAVPFVEFQRAALYGPGGFYERGRAGRRAGDFVTSPEVGPLFGAVIARYLDARWAALGRPDPFVVVDAGAGPGTLARSVLAAGPQCVAAIRYVAVEISAAQRALHPDGVESVAELPEGPFDGVIVANELLDNLPFRLCVYDGGWREAFVVDDGGRHREVLSPPLDPAPAVLPRGASHGARAPVQDEAAEFVTSALARVRRGSLLVIDYARATTAELAALPWRAWLRTYRAHERGSHYLDAPGEQDITCDVAVDQLPAPDAVRTQAQFLQLYGIAELVEEGRRAWAAGAATGDLAALRMRSRVSEAEALLAPHGLGGFLALEWHRFADSDVPPTIDVTTGLGRDEGT